MLLLRVDSSMNLQRSRSRALTETFAETWLRCGADFQVESIDLHRDPVPHLAAPALHWAPNLRGALDAPDPRDERLQSDLIAQLLRADVLLIGAPMYNWSLPSNLKAWIDHVHVLGTTAPFDMPAQPLRDRPAVIISTRGAAYDPGTPEAEHDHVVPPLRLVLGKALGMRVSVITVDRTLADVVPALRSEQQQAAAHLAAARDETRRLAAVLGSR